VSSTITARPLIRWEWVIRLAAFGPRAVSPATVAARWFRTEQARALFGGAAAHMFSRLDQPLTAAMGLLFLAGGHRYGWPVAEGGSGSIIAALAAALREHGGAITTGVTVTSRGGIPEADIVMLDLSPAAALAIYGDVMPARIKRSYRRYREGSSAFKVDFAIEGHIPWTNPECARAGMVHLGGTFAEIAFTERERAQGRMSERPFTLVGQQYLADPSRSSGNINPIWTYAHVPSGYPGDATASITDQIERFAPGFRERIVATVSKSSAELQAYNPNYIGGDIIGGANDPAAGAVPAPGGDRSLLHRRARRLPVLAIHSAWRRYPRAVRLSRRPVGVAPAAQVSQQPNRRDRPRFAAYSRSY